MKGWTIGDVLALDADVYDVLLDEILKAEAAEREKTHSEEWNGS
jgi:hypothetical protein